MSTENPQPPGFKTAQAQLVAANDLREGRDYQRALRAGSMAVDIFEALGNGVKAAEAASTRALAFRNWANEQNDSEQRNFLLSQALAEAQDAVRIGEESKNPEALAIPFFNLAKVYEDMGNLEAAVVMYEKAVTNPLPDEFPDELTRQGVVADMHSHFATALYKLTGDETVFDAAEYQLADLEKMPDSYEKFVWISGVYFRLAKALVEEDRDRAELYLQRAQEVVSQHINIPGYENLETRRLQMEKFAQDEGIELNQS